MNSCCREHVNGFSHLESDFGGLENNYDLGFKFEMKESDKPRVDPKTGREGWDDPLLILYISASHRSSPESLSTLRYGLGRSEFVGGITPNAEDETRLLEKARPWIKSDLAVLKSGRAPESTRDIVML